MQATINPGPGLRDPADLKIGQYVKVIRGRIVTGSGSVPLNTVLRVTTVAGEYYGKKYFCAEDAGRKSYCIAHDGEFTHATKSEGEAFRQAIRTKTLDGTRPANKSAGWCTGTDPEVFVLNGDGLVFPAWELLPGKDKPSYFSPEVGGSTNSGKAFFDGFQAEFTTPPFSCHGYGVDYIRNGLKTILDRAKAKQATAKLTAASVVEVPEPVLMTAPEDGVALGCDPSHNIYFEGRNTRLEEVDPKTLPFRFAGFHLHLGCGQQREKKIREMVSMMDKVAGVMSVSVLRGLEDPRRRLFYGLAGEHRLPAHGLEYRTLSSSCLCHPVVTHLVMDVARAAACWARDRLSSCWECSDEEAQHAINDLDVPLAQKVMERNKQAFLAMAKPIYADPPKAWKLVEQGAVNLLTTDDMNSVWNLSGEWRRHSNDDRATVGQWAF